MSQGDINNAGQLIQVVLTINPNKTGTSKVGAISKAQKSAKHFFRKRLESFDFFLENVA